MPCLRVELLSLACCGVDASEGLRQWELAARRHPGVGGDALNVLVVAGTITRPSGLRVIAAYAALPAPRVLVAFGACAISGGPYWDSYSVIPGLAEIPELASGTDLAVDVGLGADAGLIAGSDPGIINVPGCPPTPDDLARVLVRLAAAVGG